MLVNHAVTRIEKSIPGLLYTPLVSRLIQGGDVSMGSGLLTADQNKKVICILPNDPLVKSTANLQGVWVDLTDEMYEPDRLVSTESPLAQALANYADLLSRVSTEKQSLSTLCLVFHRDPLCPSVIVSSLTIHVPTFSVTASLKLTLQPAATTK